MADNLFQIRQKVFFDRPAVIAAIGRKKATVLARTGGFAKTVMSRGMRRREAISAPGDYPSAHGGRGASHLRDMIYFGYDRGAQVLVGPEFLKTDASILSGTRKVTRLVNEGGRITRRIIRQKDGAYKTVTQVYRPRPFVALTAPKAANALAENMRRVELK
jgi:hypothetical protein